MITTLKKSSSRYLKQDLGDAHAQTTNKEVLHNNSFLWNGNFTSTLWSKYFIQPTSLKTIAHSLYLIKGEQLKNTIKNAENKESAVGKNILKHWNLIVKEVVPVESFEAGQQVPIVRGEDRS